MLMKDSLEQEEQSATLLDVKSETPSLEDEDSDVDNCDNPVDERLHEDIKIEIDIDQTTDNCVEFLRDSENDIKYGTDTTFGQSSTPQNTLDVIRCDADGREKSLQAENTLLNSFDRIIPSCSGLKSNVEAQKDRNFYWILSDKISSSYKDLFKNSIPVQKGEKTSKELLFQKSRLEHDPKNLFLENECPTCGKIFKYKYLLKKHLLSHSGEKPFTCQTCGKTFAQNVTLRQHSRIHSGEKPFKCDTCGKSFAQRSGLCQHSEIHSGEKPFKCLTCGKAFTQKSGLYHHSRLHFGEKPFKCLTCGRAFAKRINLSDHLRIHSGEKPFKCLTCGKVFNRNSILRRHSVIHSGEKPYQCRTCGKAFSQKSGLCYHSRNHCREKPS